jgi:hypothetical protein
LKQLTAATDNAMTSGSTALSPENLANFREANDLFSRAKEYDDPSSPFYHLLRSPDGLTTANTLAGLKPERVRQFNTAMTETGNDDLNAQLQRQAINRLISPSGGEPDLKNLPTRLSRTQVEQLGGVLQPDQISNLQDLARTSRIVHADSNTSGSGKVVQRVLEGTAALKGLGTAAAGVFHANPEMVAAGLGASVVEPSLTGALAKLATNPSVVESLMAPKPALQSPSLTIPSLLAGSVLNGKDDDKPKPLTPSQKPESDADVMKRLGLTAEPTAPATAPAKPESDEDVIKRLGLTAEEKPDNQ